MPTFYEELPASDLEVKVEYSVSEFIPARMYMNNGDPGHPAEGGDIEIESVSVTVGDTEFFITDDLSDSVIDYLKDKASDHAGTLDYDDPRY